MGNLVLKSLEDQQAMQDRQADRQSESPESSKSEFSSAFRIGFVVITVLTIAVGIGFAMWWTNELPEPEPEPEPEPDASFYKLIMETLMTPINGFYEWLRN